VNRRIRELSDEDIQRIADTYHQWRTTGGSYEDVPGFCMAAPLARVQELDYVLTPGRYVGLPDDDEEFDFTERFTTLRAELEAQLSEESALNKLIADNLAKIKTAP